MATRQIDIILNLDANKTSAGASKAVKNLQAIEAQANKTREKMEKLANVGTKLALAGGAMLAPLAMAMKKYTDTVKDGEPVSKRILALNQQWEKSQVRLGKIVAEQVLPWLEKGANILEKVIRFAEENPGVVKAALTIGTTLVVLGGLIATTAQLVSTVATIQGLAAGAGIALGTGGTAAGAAGGVGLASAIATGFTLIIPALVTALAAVIGGNIGLGIGNALAGTNQTWADIWDTLKKIFFITTYFYTKMVPQMLQNLGNAIGNGIKAIGDWIGKLFGGGKAAGGYVGKGFYAVGEQGREFVLNNQTTRNAERAIGGRLTQQSAQAMITNNYQMSNGMTISQTRKMIRANEAAIMGTLAGAFS